jgi:hypothetical protein
MTAASNSLEQRGARAPNALLVIDKKGVAIERPTTKSTCIPHGENSG